MERAYLAGLPTGRGQHFRFQERAIRVHGWHDGVRADQKVAADNAPYAMWVFFDPLYRNPLVLGTNVDAQPKPSSAYTWTVGASNRCP